MTFSTPTLEVTVVYLMANNQLQILMMFDACDDIAVMDQSQGLLHVMERRSVIILWVTVLLHLILISQPFWHYKIGKCADTLHARVDC